MLLEKERKEVVEQCKRLITENLTTGSGGNISIYNREEGLIAMSPSGMDYFKTTPEDVVVVDIDGNIVDGHNKPSSELGMHLIFYKNKEQVNSVVHTHSKYATTIACMGWKLEPIHYMIAKAGYDVNCAEYATYGSQELAENALKAIGDRNAVLLGNHGLIALGKDVEDAFSTAMHLEFVSEIYYLAKTLGEPNILTEDEIKEVQEKFDSYSYK